MRAWVGGTWDPPPRECRNWMTVGGSVTTTSRFERKGTLHDIYYYCHFFLPLLDLYLDTLRTET